MSTGSKKRMVLPAALALALLAAGAFFFFGGGAARGAKDRAAARPAGAAPARAQGPAAALAPVAPDPEAGTLAADASAPDRGERVAHAAPAEAPAGPGFVIKVVSAADDAPLAGAEILACVSETAVDEAFEDMQRIDAWMEEHGARLQTDAHGEVRVPAGSTPEAWTLILARADGLFGYGKFKAPPAEGPEQDAPKLTLFPDRQLSVLTVDERGRPVAGVGVSVARGQHNWSWAVVSLSTGEDGLAHFRHVQVHRERYRGDGQEIRWLAKADVLTQAGLERAFEFEAIPAEPLRFVVPVTGTVTVHVIDVDGVPWRRGASVTLEAIREGEPRDLSPFGSDRRMSSTAEAKDSVARFPFVGLGFELALSAARQGSSPPARAYGPGPQRAGEEVRHDVVFGTDNPVVQLRALDGAGVPLAGTLIFARVEVASSFMTSDYDLEPVAESDGRIRLDLDAAYTEKDRRILHLGLGSREEPTASAMLDLSRKLEPGLHDLGDVYLAPPGVFVAGRVIDRSGAPLGGADLLLRRRKPDGDYWEHIWDFSQKSREDGTFDVRTPFEGSRFQIAAQMDGLRGLPLEFTPGDASVAIVLAGAGSVLGSLRLDDGLPTEKIKVRATPQERPREEQFFGWDDGRAEIASGGGFALRNMLPGLYDVAVELEGGSTNLHEVTGVLVTGGAESTDARLQGIDLRGRLHALHITLVPPAGRGIHQGNYTFKAAGTEEQQWGWFNTAAFDVLSTARAIDLDITVPGFQLVRLRGVDRDQTVTLSEGLSVRLVVRGDAELPEPPFFVKPSLVPAEGSESNIDWGAPVLDSSREVVVRAVEAGSMKVKWIVERRAPQGATATIVDATPEQTLEILPGVADQVFEVALSQAALDEILKALL